MSYKQEACNKKTIRHSAFPQQEKVFSFFLQKETLGRTDRQVLASYSPVCHLCVSYSQIGQETHTFNLHVLGPSQAFILSQDQTLTLIPFLLHEKKERKKRACFFLVFFYKKKKQKKTPKTQTKKTKTKNEIYKKMKELRS